MGLSTQKDLFWQELDSLGQAWQGPWVINRGGDFNIIRCRSEKQGVSFDLLNMAKFNNWIDEYYLIYFQCQDRKYTWARGYSRQMACLDRFLVNEAWMQLYSASTY